MDQNQTVDNDLQKAIDDITNNTNIDPVFSDPVAAPSSVPEGDTGELDEPVGPFASEPVAPAPVQDTGGFIAEPVPPQINNFGGAALDASGFTGDSLPDATQIPGAVVPPAPVPPQPIMDPSQPVPVPMPEPQDAAVLGSPEMSSQLPAQPVMAPEAASSVPDSGVQQIKTAALRDLIPLVDRLNLTPSQRFNVCRGIIENLKDYSVTEQAYRAASEITDDTERAEALLYIIETIDKM